MRLDQLLPECRRPRGDASRSPAWPTTTAPCTPGTLFFCVPGLHPRRPRLRRRRDRAGRGGAGRRAPARPGRPGDAGAERAGGDGAGRGGVLRRSRRRSLQTVGVTGTNGKTTTAFLVRALLEADGRQTGLLGTVKSVIGGAERPVERTTPEAIDLQRTFREMLDGGDVRVRDGGLLARARAASGRRDPLRGGDLHQPDPGPPRLPRHDGGLLPGQAPAVRGRPRRARRDQRRRPLRRAGWPARSPAR